MKANIIIGLAPRIALLTYALLPLTENSDSLFYASAAIIITMFAIAAFVFLQHPKLNIGQAIVANNVNMICADFIISLTGLMVGIEQELSKTSFFWGVLIMLSCIELFIHIRKHKTTV